LFKEENKKGSAFVEFETPEIAERVLKDYNGKIINGLLLKLNWTKLSQKINNTKKKNNNNNMNNYESSKDNQNIFYTVSLYFL
jgi:RNA recognition motif-containing protein